LCAYRFHRPDCSRRLSPMSYASWEATRAQQVCFEWISRFGLGGAKGQLAAF
jgi:hypothetical protein